LSDRRLGVTHYIAVLITADGARRRVYWRFHHGWPAPEIRTAVRVQQPVSFDACEVPDPLRIAERTRYYRLMGQRKPGDRRYYDYMEQVT
jgi:predicted GTPase